MATQTVESLIEGGKASAAPPLGPALGPLGVNIGQIIAEINKKTASFKGMQVPIKIVVDKDTKAFTISVGTPPASALILKESGAEKGSGKPNKDKVADLKIEQIIKIAKMKEDDLLGKDLKRKIKEIIGTCDSMGILVEGMNPRDAMKEVDSGKFDEEIRLEKTELSVEELKALEQEKLRLQEEVAARHAAEEKKANEIVESMKGKEKSAIRLKMREAGISEDVIKKLLPQEAAVPADGKPSAAPGAAAAKK